MCVGKDAHGCAHWFGEVVFVLVSYCLGYGPLFWLLFGSRESELRSPCLCGNYFRLNHLPTPWFEILKGKHLKLLAITSV